MYDASYDAYNELNFYINSLGWCQKYRFRKYASWGYDGVYPIYYANSNVILNDINDISYDA